MVGPKNDGSNRFTYLAEDQYMQVASPNRGKLVTMVVIQCQLRIFKPSTRWIHEKKRFATSFKKRELKKEAKHRRRTFEAERSEKYIVASALMNAQAGVTFGQLGQGS